MLVAHSSEAHHDDPFTPTSRENEELNVLDSNSNSTVVYPEKLRCSCVSLLGMGIKGSDIIQPLPQPTAGTADGVPASSP